MKLHNLNNYIQLKSSDIQEIGAGLKLVLRWMESSRLGYNNVKITPVRPLSRENEKLLDYYWNVTHI